MTERLYLEDSHLFNCKATVTACEQNADGTYAIELDKTVFFPNKGGQPCDTGSIGTVNITSCDEKGERLLHTAAAPLNIGAEYEVQIDKERRMDIMRQHTGEHILSWAAYMLFGAVNVGSTVRWTMQRWTRTYRWMMPRAKKWKFWLTK